MVKKCRSVVLSVGNFEIDFLRGIAAFSQSHAYSMGVGKNESSRSNRGSDSQTELSDRMLQQSLRVSWRRLAAEVDRVLEFRAFSLWTRAILEIEGSIPDEVLASIEERCRGFGMRKRGNRELGSLWTDLLAWSEQFVFIESKAGGWIEAAHYYSGLDPRSEQTWLHMERSLGEWSEQRPTRYPEFTEWRKAAQAMGLEIPPATQDKAIEAIAFSYWAVLLVAVGDQESFLLGEIETRCPGFFTNNPLPPTNDADALARFRTAIAENLQARHEDSQRVKAAAMNHLRTIRIKAYFDACLGHVQIPPFQVWLQDADEFIVDP
jgi:hypothetical protein